MPPSGPFSVPLTFPVDADLRTQDFKSRNVIESSFVNSSPSCIISWCPEQAESVEGLVLGTQDGSLYILHPERLKIDSDIRNSRVSTLNSAPESPRKLAESRATSRSVSPSLFSPPPFHVSTRSKIVSGITAERVEAPKNYVDFDDEPGKLKDMLQGHAPTTESKEQPALTTRKERPKSLLSATNSPSAFSTKMLSVPTSPTQASKRPQSIRSSKKRGDNLRLVCHVIPPHPGAVSAIQLVDDGPLVVVLQKSGELSVIDIRDGTCSVSTHIDSTAILPPNGIQDEDFSSYLSTWNHLKIYKIGETTLILAGATVTSYETSTVADDDRLKSRVAVFSLGHSRDKTTVEKFGQWYFDGPVDSCGVHPEPGGTHTFYSLTWDGHFIIRKIAILPVSLPPAVLVEDHSDNFINLDALAKPFVKALNKLESPSSENVSSTHTNGNGKANTKVNPETGATAPKHSRISLDSTLDLGLIQLQSQSIPWGGFELRSTEGGELRGLAWSDTQAFTYGNNGFRSLFSSSFADVHRVRWVNDTTYAVVYKASADVYTLKAVDADGDEVNSSSSSRHVNMIATKSGTVKSHPDLTEFISTSTLLTIDQVNKQVRQLVKRAVASGGGEEKNQQQSEDRALWKTSTDSQPASSPSTTRLSSVLPLELNHIILGYSDGYIRRTSIPLMIQDEILGEVRYDKISNIPLHEASILSLHVAQNTRTKEQFIVGGGDDGSIAFWSSDTLKMCAKWIVFISPLQHVLQFPDTQQQSPLRGCALCISQDGTIAVIAVDGFQFLYVIPGAAPPLQRLCLGGEGGATLLLQYADGRARLWDVKTREFWRSVPTAEKVGEILNQAGWTELSILPTKGPDSRPFRCLLADGGLDSVSTLIFNLEEFLADSSTIIKSISSSRNQTLAILATRDKLCSILSTLITTALNDDIDAICRRMGISCGCALLGTGSVGGTTTLYATTNAREVWSVSGDVSAARALSICACLRTLSLFEELTDGANTVIAFYAASLGSCVGDSYCPPSLSYLALRWFDSSNELRQTARTLFDAAVARLTDDETLSATDDWQHGLPCLQPTADRESFGSALSLFVSGYIAAEKYSLIPTSVLTDISKSIALYLNDEESNFRVLAIDLCSRGFHVWQHYIDAMEILRALFTLATSSKKEGITPQNVGAQARLAVLQIASSNSPLFMTTLSLDVATPSGLEHRKAVMQIVAFLIRKRPMVLAPSLPKLMEAVVKSLDPNLTSHRDAIIDTATEILGHVVKTFPFVDFHMSSQRLAVGTSEGALIMYDLKTAIRLYVLEGHKQSITGCSFSPDGRRLVTLSLAESVVLVWKVGSSFSSFFNPGAPPRQGHAGNEPFKTLSFNVGDQANMTPSAALEFVKFEWPAERSVRVRIKESTLTFST